MERTNRNGTLRLADVGKKVVLLGWIAKTRKLGGLFFADLRDTTGYIQLVSEHPDDLPDVRNEYVVEVRGIVRKKDVRRDRALRLEVFSGQKKRKAHGHQ